MVIYVGVVGNYEQRLSLCVEHLWLCGASLIVWSIFDFKGESSHESNLSEFVTSLSKFSRRSIVHWNQLSCQEQMSCTRKQHTCSTYSYTAHGLGKPRSWVYEIYEAINFLSIQRLRSLGSKMTISWCHLECITSVMILENQAWHVTTNCSIRCIEISYMLLKFAASWWKRHVCLQYSFQNHCTYSNLGDSTSTHTRIQMTGSRFWIRIRRSRLWNHDSVGLNTTLHEHSYFALFSCSFCPYLGRFSGSLINIFLLISYFVLTFTVLFLFSSHITDFVIILILFSVSRIVFF